MFGFQLRSPPKTMGEMGLFAPFTTDALVYGKLRSAPDCTIEVMTVSFSGSSSVYILPLKDLPAVMPLTPHDLIFRDIVLGQGRLSPRSLREAGLRALVSCGGEKAVVAERRLDQLALEAAGTSWALFGAACRQVLGREPDISMPAYMAWDPADGFFSCYLDIAAALGMQPPVLHGIIRQWSGLVVPLGPPESGDRELRQDLQRIRELAVTLREWRDTSPVLGRKIGLAASALDAFLAGAERTVRAADQAFRNFRTSAGRWQLHGAALRTKLSQLESLADNWRVVAAVAQAQKGLYGSRRENLAWQVVRLAPVPPVSQGPVPG